MKESVKHIWKNCFVDSEHEVDFYFDNLYNKDNIVAIYQDNKIVGCIHRNKYTLLFNNKFINSRFYVGVGILPEYRGRGILNELMIKAFEFDDDFVYLHPSNPQIYEKYGFIYISSLEIFETTFNNVKGVNHRLFSVEINLGNLKHYSNMINGIYHNYMSDRILYVWRDEKTLDNLISEIISDGGKIILVFDENKNPSGYMIYYPQKDVIVREIIALDKKSMEHMLYILTTYSDYYDKIIFKMAINSGFEIFLKNDKSKKVIPYIMGRFKNINILLDLIKDNNITIKINDNFISQNNAIYTIKNGIISKNIKNEYDFEIDIASLTALIFGATTLKQLFFLGEINKIPKLNLPNLLPCYIQDYE